MFPAILQYALFLCVIAIARASLLSHLYRRSDSVDFHPCFDQFNTCYRHVNYEDSLLSNVESWKNVINSRFWNQFCAMGGNGTKHNTVGGGCFVANFPKQSDIPIVNIYPTKRDVTSMTQCQQHAAEGICSFSEYVKSQSAQTARVQKFVCDDSTLAEWVAMADSECVRNAEKASAALHDIEMCWERHLTTEEGPTSAQIQCQKDSQLLDCMDNALTANCGPAYGVFFRSVTDTFPGVLTDNAC